MNKSTRYKRTPGGMAVQIYAHQKSHSARRGHALPSYNSKELLKWLFSQDSFAKMFDEWVASDYCTNLRPSVDRIDDTKGYSFANIQLTTWGGNNTKGHESLRKIVMQYTKEGVFIAEHISAKHATIAIGKTNLSNITRCCRGNSRTAYGYKWEYKL